MAIEPAKTWVHIGSRPPGLVRRPGRRAEVNLSEADAYLLGLEIGQQCRADNPDYVPSWPSEPTAGHDIMNAFCQGLHDGAGRPC